MPKAGASPTDNRQLSDNYGRLVGIVFAVVIGKSIGDYGNLLFVPSLSVAFVALVGVYSVIILSWTGYHTSLVDFPYTRSFRSLLRLFADFSIVVAYAFLLWTIGHVKLGERVDTYVIAYLLIFGLYIISGRLRQSEYGRQASRQGLLWIAFAGYAVLLAAYKAGLHAFEKCQGLFDWMAVVSAIGIMVAWRAARRIGGDSAHQC